MYSFFFQPYTELISGLLFLYSEHFRQVLRCFIDPFSHNLGLSSIRNQEACIRRNQMTTNHTIVLLHIIRKTKKSNHKQFHGQNETKRHSSVLLFNFNSISQETKGTHRLLGKTNSIQIDLTSTKIPIGK